MRQGERYLLFDAGGERFGISLDYVQEMVRHDEECLPLPQAPECLAGMMNRRGRNLPILDIAKRLGLPEARGDSPRVVILVKINNIEVALLVDRVEEVSSVGESMLDSSTLESLKRSLVEPFTQGIAKDSHHQAVILLRPESLLEGLSPLKGA